MGLRFSLARGAVALFLAVFVSPIAALADDLCPDKWDSATLAARLAAWASPPPGTSVALYSRYRTTPAGAETAVVVDRLYDDATDGKPSTGVKNLTVRVIFQQKRHSTPSAEDVRVGYSPIFADRLSGDDSFAKSMGFRDGLTRLHFDVPAGLGGGFPFVWNAGRLTLIGCKEGKLEFIGQMDTAYSWMPTSLALTVVVTILLYVFAARCVYRYEKKYRVPKLKWYRFLDPVVLCSDPDAKGSISRLQILFFSILVFAMLMFIVLRVGLLVAMSPTVLLLLGISATGAAASKVADNQKQRLSFDNWAWLIRKRWLPVNGLAAVNVAKWGDILTGNDGFDVYHFQMLVFSLVVGVGMLKVGFTGLETFDVPEGMLALLGLSQTVYVAGKLVDQPTVKELDDALGALRKLESSYIAANAADRPSALNAYNAKRDSVRIMLGSFFVGYDPAKPYTAADGTTTSPNLELG